MFFCYFLLKMCREKLLLTLLIFGVVFGLEAFPGIRGNTGASTGGSTSSAPTTGQVLSESTCGAYLNEYIRSGYKNNPEEVKKLQIFLNSFLGTNLIVDGMYNTATQTAVSQFQKKQSVHILKPWNITSPTGIVYITTKTEINNIMCKTIEQKLPNKLINWKDNPGTESILKF